MKILASSPERRTRRTNPENGAGGFTLLEILVVLLIVGLTNAVVVPRLPLVADRLDFALKRQSFEQNLGTLSYRAFADSHDFVLAGHYDDQGLIDDNRQRKTDSESLNPRMRALPANGETEREYMAPVLSANASLQLPDGWELVVDEPIFFRSSGYCTGGKAEVLIGRLRYNYTLQAPTCEVVLSD